MDVSQILEKMIVFSKGNLHDIDHFIRVWTYAKMIGELENLESSTQYILEIAAITHDIACPFCREKYGNTNGKYQEIEGVALVTDFLSETKISNEQIERVAYLVGHHHTLDDVVGKDYMILLEADFIVNAIENGYEIRKFVADWDKYGKAAGPIRNEQMAIEADYIICFWDYKSRGTKSMIENAKKYSKPYKIKNISLIKK